MADSATTTPATHALEVRDLRTYFDTDDGVVKSVNGVSFHLDRNETLGIVGESGSGKSVTSLSIMRLVKQPPGRFASGEILLEGDDLLKKSKREMRAVRGNRIAMIFQDPLTSLNPVLTIGRQMTEGIRLHLGVSKREARDQSIERLREVGLPRADERLDDYPHQFSGGQRQRIMIAMALSCDPEILIADEPTTALDVTIQAQILRLMQRLQERKGSGIIMITHDLGVVARIADRIMVMYAGRIAEYGTVEEIYYAPSHPYTWGLLKSVPSVSARNDRLIPIPGTPPSLINPPEGCPFRPRCRFSQDVCKTPPPYKEVSPGHFSLCHFAGQEILEKERATERMEAEVGPS
jgi:oligopeptide transport system ATP-binding protein